MNADHAEIAVCEASPVVDEATWLRGLRVALVGRLGSMTRPEAQSLIARFGGTVVRADARQIDMFVVGADAWPLELQAVIPERLHPEIAAGKIEVVSETEFWSRFGLLDADSDVRKLYTPAMLADLLGVSVATIRNWSRRGLITPVREIHRLAYFDYQEVVTARRLAKLVADGMPVATIAGKLQQLAQWVPGIHRPLTQLSIIAEGRELLMRTRTGVVEPSGQKRFDFGDYGTESDTAVIAAWSLPLDPAASADEMAVRGSNAEMTLDPGNLLDRALHLDSMGQCWEAIEHYRLAALEGGPRSDVHFAMADLFYRLGDLSAARERYYSALELEPDFVEARANLGCVLAEEGHTSLAVAALHGAIARHPKYADAHYHLARILDQMNDPQAAEEHWRAFIQWAPHSPWVDEACDRLGILRS